MKHFHEACWISGPAYHYGPEDVGYYHDHPNYILTNTFTAKKEEKAVLKLAALGLYTCRINGKLISDTVLNGAWTNFTKLVYFDTYDVTSLLAEGDNTIEIELGNGYWNPSPLRFFGKYNLRERLAEVGDPMVLLTLEQEGKTLLASDDSWSWKEGNLLFNNIYLGEKADLRKSEKKTGSVRTISNHRNLAPALANPNRKFQAVEPKSVIATEEGLVADFGEVVNGFIEIDVHGKNGQMVKMTFAESMRDGQLDFFGNANGSVGETMPDGRKVWGGPGSPENGWEVDTLILEEGCNHYENTFTNHSFRFVLIQGIEKENLDSLCAWYVHADLAKTGSVHTDNDHYNLLMDAALRTKLNNIHFSFEDCARERLGYGGDMVTLADSNLYTFDLHDMYKKIVIDFRLDQTPAGGIPETAPFMGIGSQGTAYGEGPLLWQYCYPYLIEKLIQFYGDTDLARQEYPFVKKHMDYLLSWKPDELAQHCLGDHGSVLIAGEFYMPTPAKVFSTYVTQLLFLDTFLYISRAIGIKESELVCYKEHHDDLKEQIIRKFKREDGSFDDDTQTALAFAAAAKLDDPEVLTAKLAAKIQEEGLMTAGIFGMKWTYDLLHAYGYDQIIEDWLFAEGEISFKSMLASGNKAFAELFKGRHFSASHAMFTSFVTWFYQGLGGIQITHDGKGVMLQPFFSNKTSHVDCEVKTRFGTITSRWNRTEEKIHWHVSIPAAMEVRLPELPENCHLHLERTKKTTIHPMIHPSLDPASEAMEAQSTQAGALASAVL